MSGLGTDYDDVPECPPDCERAGLCVSACAPRFEDLCAYCREWMGDQRAACSEDADHCLQCRDECPDCLEDRDNGYYDGDPFWEAS